MKNAKHFLQVSKAANKQKIDDEIAKRKQFAQDRLDQVTINQKWWRTEGVEHMLNLAQYRAELGTTNAYREASDIPADVIRILERLKFKVELEYNDVLISWGEYS